MNFKKLFVIVGIVSIFSFSSAIGTIYFTKSLSKSDLSNKKTAEESYNRIATPIPSISQTPTLPHTPTPALTPIPTPEFEHNPIGVQIEELKQKLIKEAYNYGKSVDMANFYLDYKTDYNQANKKYKDKKIIMITTVTHKDETIEETPYFICDVFKQATIANILNKEYWSCIEFNFNKLFKYELDEISTGKQVAVCGTCKGKNSNGAIYLDDCVIIPKEYIKISD